MSRAMGVLYLTPRCSGVSEPWACRLLDSLEPDLALAAAPGAPEEGVRDGVPTLSGSVRPAQRIRRGRSARRGGSLVFPCRVPPARRRGGQHP